MFNNTQKPYFIAEIGVNHEGCLQRAFEMIESVAKSGADCAKFQTYKAANLAARESPAYWDQSKEPTKSQFDLFNKYDRFEREDYEQLKKKCDEQGVDFLSTPFDIECLPWLMPMMKFAKVASADLTNFLLIKEIAAYHKPIALSVGASSLLEIRETVDFLVQQGVTEICLLHCVLQYPTPASNAFLNRILELNQLRQAYNIEITLGYSDHIPSNVANDDQVISAVSMGAQVIEKHFTFDKSLPGNDHYHAMDADDLQSLTARVGTLCDMITPKDEQTILASQESAILNARRSLYYRCNLSAGHILDEKDLIAKRPGYGVSPKLYREYLGKPLACDVDADAPVSDIDFV